jgi:lipopolysaccharide transport protein LptA
MLAGLVTLAACPVVAAVASKGSRASAATVPTPHRGCGTAEIDFKGKASFERNHLVVHGVTITLTEADCTISLTVTADVAEAGGKGFNNDDTWSVSGQVVMTMPEGELRADSAQVVLKAGIMRKATVRGSPATFVQATPVGENAANSARGQAAVIGYDAASGDLELLGDISGKARLQDDSRQLNHQRIVYNLRQHTMQAGSNDPSQRGTITIKRPPKATP